MSDLGNQIKELRLLRGLTQEELGKKLNLSKQTVSSYEKGTRTPDPETVTKLAKIFNVSTDFLLGQTDDPKPNKSRELPQTVAPYLPEGFDELSPEAKEEVLNYIDYIMVKYAKKEGKNKN